MRNNKSNSMIHIPFSWEKIPGVPKFVASPMRAMTPKINEVLPMPPGSFRQPVRSVSKRMFLWEEDPFLAAMIECTKDCDHKYKGKGEIKKSFGTKVGTSKASTTIATTRICFIWELAKIPFWLHYSTFDLSKIE
ncbi:hypothetical protein L1987_18139 [Smallanthus sonchifolius]|uniref:Uncharacterized protein n=1 Tax=Smallanthus sonchifolius TaxID=185202 RepID=A0ACB9J2C9_9ASTR|nr:hypothetical protein L1987_18139 [Smallanthus sonchifolius]